jgi:hypothetical protein
VANSAQRPEPNTGSDFADAIRDKKHKILGGRSATKFAVIRPSSANKAHFLMSRRFLVLLQRLYRDKFVNYTVTILNINATDLKVGNTLDFKLRNSADARIVARFALA